MVFPASGTLVFRAYHALSRHCSTVRNAAVSCRPRRTSIPLALHDRVLRRPHLQPQPSGPSCQACSNRLPHDASSSTYVIAEGAVSSTATDYRHPPGARPGTLFAVMDPVPCRCVIDHDQCGAEGDVGKRKAGSETGSGDEVRRMTREPYDPPVLWPVNGDKFAYQRDRGPVAHGLRLKSAYAQQADAWGTGEPAFSSYHHMFKVTASALTR